MGMAEQMHRALLGLRPDAFEQAARRGQRPAQRREVGEIPRPRLFGQRFEQGGHLRQTPGRRGHPDDIAELGGKRIQVKHGLVRPIEYPFHPEGQPVIFSERRPYAQRHRIRFSRPARRGEDKFRVFEVNPRVLFHDFPPIDIRFHWRLKRRQQPQAVTGAGKTVYRLRRRHGTSDPQHLVPPGKIEQFVGMLPARPVA